MNKTEITKIVENELLEFFDAKTLLRHNKEIMEFSIEATLKAINYTHCCKSDSEQLKVCVDIPSFAYWLKDNEYESTKNSNILTKHKEKYSRTKLFRWYRDEYNL